MKKILFRGFQGEMLFMPEALVIKRDQLKDIVSFAGTLLHETTHAISGATDITIEFENKLTHFLGKLSEANLK